MPLLQTVFDSVFATPGAETAMTHAPHKTSFAAPHLLNIYERDLKPRYKFTDEGIENADFVVSVVYQYLAMLRNEGPHEWIFNESRDIAAINFLFKSKSRPIDYSVSCATSMQIYPPERTITGSSKLPRTHDIFCG